MTGRVSRLTGLKTPRLLIDWLAVLLPEKSFT
jgi:hypothetical protein